jgi:AraC-like DNA-binding protein
MGRLFRRYFSVSSADRQWGLFVSSAGHNIVAAGEAYPVGNHPEGYHFEWKRGRILDEFALLLIADGEGVFEHRKSSSLLLRRGDVLLLPPGALHRYRPNPITGWEEYWVTFDGATARDWHKQNLFVGRWPLLARNMHLAVTERFEELVSKARQPTYAPQTLAAFAQLVLFEALSFSSNEVMRLSPEMKLRQAAETIRKHPAQFNLNVLASVAEMPESTFRRKFLELFGVTPARYAQDERMTQAKRWLLETPLTVRDIADRLEFSSEFYFMRAFKRNTGKTPSRWRQNPRSIAAVD